MTAFRTIEEREAFLWSSLQKAVDELSDTIVHGLEDTPKAFNSAANQAVARQMLRSWEAGDMSIDAARAVVYLCRLDACP